MLMETKPNNRGDLHVVHLDTDCLRVTLLLEIGCKIASIIYKPNQFEALACPLGHETAKEQTKLYARAYPGAPFDQYDLSGIDDCIPTIDPCHVEKLENKLVYELKKELGEL